LWWIGKWMRDKTKVVKSKRLLIKGSFIILDRRIGCRGRDRTGRGSATPDGEERRISGTENEGREGEIVTQKLYEQKIGPKEALLNVQDAERKKENTGGGKAKKKKGENREAKGLLGS